MCTQFYCIRNSAQFPVYSDTCTRRAGVLTGAAWALTGTGRGGTVERARGVGGRGRRRRGLYAGIRGRAREAEKLKCSQTHGEALQARQILGGESIDPTRYEGKLRYFNVLKWEENAKNPPTFIEIRAFFPESGRKYRVFPPLFQKLL